MIKVAIADDHKLVRKSLSLLLDTTENIRVVAEASNGAELLEVLKTTAVDTLLLDIQMPVMNGFETAKKVTERYPNIKILILTMMDDDNTIREIINYADGFYTKNTDPEELEKAILKLEKTGFYFEQSLAEIISRLQKTAVTTEAIPDKIFSDREKQIIILTALELNNKEIADRLHISKRTVDRHKEILREVHKTKNFTGVIMLALRQQAISLADIT